MTDAGALLRVTELLNWRQYEEKLLEGCRPTRTAECTALLDRLRALTPAELETLEVLLTDGWTGDLDELLVVVETL